MTTTTTTTLIHMIISKYLNKFNCMLLEITYNSVEFSILLQFFFFFTVYSL